MNTFYTYTFLLALTFLASTAQSQDKPDSPYHLKTQFAGDIGLVAVGIGRGFFQEKLDADLLLGYLPESVGGDRIVTAALKAAYVPLQEISIGAVDWQPLRTGLQLSHTFGVDYFAFEPRDKYPEPYYKFSTSLHLYYFLGGELALERVKHLERFGVYYEMGALGEYIISYLTNPKYLGPGQIFHLALGVKFDL